MRAQQWEVGEENDWILLDSTDLEGSGEEAEERKDKGPKGESTKRPVEGSKPTKVAGETSLFFFFNAKSEQKRREKRRQMALDAADIKLIRASWVPARKDPGDSGALLFKGLFTKFPDYLKFFSQFTDLDIENLHENKRLVKHAVKVIDTVSFVVDCIGEERKADELNDALINLVRGHLKRRIGLQEFRNLGIVIIDFVCDLQQRRRASPVAQTYSACNHHSIEPPIVSSKTETQEDLCKQCQNYNHNHNNHQDAYSYGIDGSGNSGVANDTYIDNEPKSSPPSNIIALETNLLVKAWTKLYGSILDLVEREERDPKNHS